MADSIKIDLTKEQAEYINQAHGEFHHAFGTAMAEWAGLERSLYYWFARITRMNHEMASAVFYSGRSFNARADMLQAAIDRADVLTKIEAMSVQEALKKVWAYSGFRNSMAHGEPMMQIVELAGQPKTFSYVLTQGKHTKPNPAAEISIQHLMIAAENFHNLKCLILDLHPGMRGKDAPTPEECLALLRTLPSQANSKSAQNPSGPAQQPEDPARRNKKEYRAGQQAKKPKAAGE